MASNQFYCAGCNVKYRAKAHKPGKTYTCPKCGQKLSEQEQAKGAVAQGTLDVRGQLQRADTDPLIGKTIGRYQILSKLGEGGMGAVYRVKHTLLGRISALKLMSPELVAKLPVAVERFQREARTAAKLKHPNIVTTYDVGQEGDHHFIDLEYVDGESLQERMRREKRLDPAEAMRIVLGVAEGLAAAQKQHVAHRDIKPANIMVTAEGGVKVMDFGLAKDVRTASDLTMTGQIMGTPYYMSPEQARGKPADTRSDIYSLGATYYYLLTGKPPYTGDSAMAILFQHIEEPVPDVRERCSALPATVHHVIAKAMAKAPTDRYGTAREMAVDLKGVRTELQRPDGGRRSPREALDDNGEPSGVPTDDASEVPGQSSLALLVKKMKPMRLALALIPIVLVLGIAAWQMWPRPERQKGTGGEVRTLETREQGGTKPPPSPPRLSVTPFPPPVPKPEPVDRVTASVDEHGRIIVNGRPFFPIGLRGLPEESDLEKMADLAAAGVNWSSCQDPVLQRHAASLGILTRWIVSERDENALRQRVSEQQGMPGQVAWELGTSGTSGSTHIAWMHSLTKRLDPDRLTVVLVPTDPQTAEEVVRNCGPVADLLLPYHYPKPKRLISTGAEIVRTARKLTGGTKAVVPLTQTHGLWVWWPTGGSPPTPHEFRAMLYQAIINGAAGVEAYRYGFLAETPDLLAEFKAIAAELNALSPAILATDERFQSLSGEDDLRVDLLSKVHQNALYIFAANRATRRSEISVCPDTDMDFSSATVLVGSNDMTTVDARDFADVLEPLDVRVYRIAGAKSHDFLCRIAVAADGSTPELPKLATGVPPGPLSPDRYTAFCVYRAGKCRAHLYDAAEDSAGVFIESRGEETFASLSPDGTKLAFASNVSGDMELFVADLVSHRVQQLTHDRIGRSGTSFVPFTATWSPNSDAVAYPFGDYLYLTKLAQGVPAEMPGTARAKGEMIWLSKDRMVFARDHTATRQRVSLASWDDGRVMPFMSTFRPGISPNWRFGGLDVSSDGSRLVFAATVGSGKDVFWLSSTGRRPTRVTHTRESEVSLTMSPDGAQVAFVRKQHEAEHRLYVANLAGQSERPLTSKCGHYYSLFWSPDGKRVIFASKGETEWDVLSVPADGSSEPRSVFREDAGGRQKQNTKEDKTKLPSGLEKAFMLPDSDKDQHGNPVHVRNDSKFDPETGYPHEIWLKEPRMEFVFVPSGEFMMGSSLSPGEVWAKYPWPFQISPSKRKQVRDQIGRARPRHRVRLTQPYYLGKYEVTQSQWQAMTGGRPWSGKQQVKEGARYSATYTSWLDCEAFLAGLTRRSRPATFRMPTEAEWEYACRAGSTSQFCYGDSQGRLSEFAWYFDNACKVGEFWAHPVGKKLPNAWGLYDMHGNVREQCQHGSVSYPPGLCVDPTEPRPTVTAVIRGRGINFPAARCRSAHPDGYPTRHGRFSLGLRVALPLSQQQFVAPSTSESSRVYELTKDGYVSPRGQPRFLIGVWLNDVKGHSASELTSAGIDLLGSLDQEATSNASAAETGDAFFLMHADWDIPKMALGRIEEAMYRRVDQCKRFKRVLGYWMGAMGKTRTDAVREKSLLREASDAIRRAGAEHLLVYGIWNDADHRRFKAAGGTADLLYLGITSAFGKTRDPRELLVAASSWMATIGPYQGALPEFYLGDSSSTEDVAKLRCSMYAAAICGANGFFIWCGGKKKHGGNQRLPTEVLRTTRELRTISPQLAQPCTLGKRFGPMRAGEVCYVVKKHSDWSLVLAANLSDRAQQVELRLPEDMQNRLAKALFEGRFLQAKGELLADTFGPYGVHAYAITDVDKPGTSGTPVELDEAKAERRDTRPTIVVKQDGSGQHRTLIEAISAARDGSTIEIQDEGVYEAPRGRLGRTRERRRNISIRGPTDGFATLSHTRNEQALYVGPGWTVENLRFVRARDRQVRAINTRGINVFTPGEVTIRRCVFQNLRRGIVVGYPNVSTTAREVVVEDCLFMNMLGALTTEGPTSDGHTEVTFTRNTVIDTGQHGIGRIGRNPKRKLRVTDSLFALRRAAHTFWDRYHPLFTAEDFWVSDWNCYAPTRGIFGSGGTAHAPNESIQAGDWLDATGNDLHSIHADPHFAGSKRSDFRQRPTSPCNGTASDGGDMGVRWSDVVWEAFLRGEGTP